MNDSTRNGFRYITRLLAFMLCWLSMSAQAQDKVTVMVTPVQQVLPPQAARYISNPGKYFTVWLKNNTDEEQLVHLGLQIQQRFPDPEELWVSTNMESGHIPQQPIVLAPNQQKLLNPIEMSHLFNHFTKSDVYIKEGRYYQVTDGDYGLLPEGEFEAFLTAYRWDSNLTTKEVLSDPSGGNAIFNICYEAEPPKFTSPVITDMDGGLGELKVVKFDKNQPVQFSWIAPTLNCNAPLVNFEYAVRIVEKGNMEPDEAMFVTTPTFHEQKNLIPTTFTLSPDKVRQMIEEGQAYGKVYALQVTASTTNFSGSNLNFSLLKNDGKSPIILFQLYDPQYTEPDQGDDGGDDGGGGYSLTLDDVSGKYDDIEELYVFSQPKLISPSFSGRTYRTVYLGENMDVEWQKAWFEGGRGMEQDTIKFKYTVGLYMGNTVDKPETIFQYNPIFEKKDLTECEYSIDWSEVEGEFEHNTYFYVRVTATPINEELVRMLPDDKNYVDFVLTDGFVETFECGNSTANVDNITTISEKPAINDILSIGAWELTFDEKTYNDVKLENGVLKGTGWINWPNDRFPARIAVKFEDLKVNTDKIVFEGTCKTRANPTTQQGNNVTINGKSYSPDEIASSLFSQDALNDIYGTAGMPAEIQEQVQNEGASVGQSYNIGQYYSMYKQAENLWTSGSADLYFPLELRNIFKGQLPEDFNVQIADMSFSPTAAIMNVIAEIVMPNSDVVGGQVLVFGAPRLCVEPDRILPEDGVISLLSNFSIKDPSSEFVLTFKAPTDPLDPDGHDGSFIRWEDDKFQTLGLEVAMSLPNTKRIINDEVHDDIPALLDLYAEIQAGESAVNFLAEGTLTPFEVNDLPGWKFCKGSEDNGNSSGLTVIFDHSTSTNGKGMGANRIKTLYPNFDFSQCGSGVSEANWNAWTGVFIDGLTVEFPKFAVFGDGKEGLRIGAYNMLIDGSGITCKTSAENILSVQTGSCGSWAFSVKNASVEIVQNNFDKCNFDGSFGVPLLGRAAQKQAAEETKNKHPKENIDVSDNNGKDNYEDIEYHCEIRHLTAEDFRKWDTAGTGEESADAGEKAAATSGEKSAAKRGYINSMAYVFSTTNINDEDLTLNFVLGNMTLNSEQTYFLVESIEDNPDKEGDQSYTQVELCMAGDITIAGTSKVNEGLTGLKSRLGKLGDLIESTKLPIHMPGIHFAKMRLSNKKEDDWRDLGLDKNNLHQGRLDAQKKWIEDNNELYHFTSGKEIELSEGDCYFNYGEWSLASEGKKIGPFTFNLDGFTPSMTGDKFSLDIKGSIGFAGEKDNMISASGGFSISGVLHKEGGIKNIKDWYISDGDVNFNSFGLECDFSLLHLKGDFEFGTNKDNENERGFRCNELTIDIKDLFAVSCTGGYYNHTASNLSDEEKNLLKADNPDLDKTANSSIKDVNYSWGYFTISLKSTVGLRFDPIVINRISGGFYFNCRPQAAEKAEGEKCHDFSGTPKGQYGMIGIAFGVGMSTSAGEKVLKVDADVLVVYDRENNCLSAFKFDGGVEAVGGLIKADATLVYVNDKKAGVDEYGNKTSTTLDRYLCLNITAEAGVDNERLKEIAGKVNEKLESLKKTFEKFSSDVKGFSNNPKSAMQGLKRLSGKWDKDENDKLSADATGDETVEDTKGMSEEEKKKRDDQRDDLGLPSVMKVKVQLEFMITWVKNGLPREGEPGTPKWHLYLGEPTQEKRCSFTYIDFDSKICSAHIGADGYICVGNELPILDNGDVLPPIPDKISEFLSGHKYSNADMGADEAKAERSRKAAVKAMLNPSNINGGIMVGASAWGDISIDLGLLKGSLGAMAGFDASLINYGSSAFCVNNGSSMGYNGWYAMGQLYAYLWANLGVHIDLGALFDDDVWFFDAGIGGVLEVGLPHPSWVEGKARIKMVFLSGLFKVDKQFKFSAGDHCVPFRGNALDGFSLFSGVSMGSDSLYQALCRPEFAVSKADVSKMIVSTNASLGSHYRLIDPTWVVEMAKDHLGLEESEVNDEIRDKLSLQASRTYVFDMLKETNDYGKLGVRLIDLGEAPTDMVKRNPEITEEQFYEGCRQNLNPTWEESPYDDVLAAVASKYYKRDNTVYDGSRKMNSYNIKDTWEGEVIKQNQAGRISDLLQREVINTNTGNAIPTNGGVALVNGKWVSEINEARPVVEQKVNFREDKGQTYHLCDMKVEEGHSYALILTGTAYEINNGEKMWCQYYYNNGDKKEETPMKWNQEKIWFFRVKDAEEDKIDKYELSTLEPYVALAYPSVDGVKVKNDSTAAFTAYYNDIMYPNIALNRDLTQDIEYKSLKWTLTAYDKEDFETNPEHKPLSVETKYAKYLTDPATTSTSSGNTSHTYVNIVPWNRFSDVANFKNRITQEGKNYDFSNELYHLQLGYTFKASQSDKETTVNLVDLWVTAAPHHVTINGTQKTDSWFESTSPELTGELLDYVEPFVGVSPSSSSYIDYDGLYDPSDDAIVFGNYKYNGITPLRLVDPWLYLAYLSKWTFIGDHVINSYAFDTMPVMFASESLIYDYNGAVINSDFTRGEKSKSLWQMRNEMYGTWNDWHYNNTNQPEWPLPSTLKTVGGITAANQNGRVSTFKPLNLRLNKPRALAYSDLLWNFDAPYSVASTMNSRLKEEARGLYDTFAKYWNKGWGDNGAAFDEEMRNYNNLHRGEYLEYNYRGVTARVPYYQLPLVFGGCFSYGILGSEIQTAGDRTLAKSIGRSQDTAEFGRWDKGNSNLLFFRLIGNEQQPKYNNQPIKSFLRNDWLSNYKSYPYPDSDKERRLEVEFDEFDINRARSSVLNFYAHAYRVDSYNMNTGEYVVLKRGGTPWEDTFELGKNGIPEDWNEALGMVGEEMSPNLEEKYPYAVWTESDKTLTLLYTDQIYKKGDTFQGKTITDVWRGDYFMRPDRHKSIREAAENVYVDYTMHDMAFTSLGSWFKDFKNVKRITGMDHINWENVTNVSHLFENCESLTEVNLSSMKDQAWEITDMSSMFENCKSLKFIDVSFFSTGKVRDMSRMFRGCEQVEQFYLGSFTSESLVSTQEMFADCKNLKDLSLGFDGKYVKNCSQMFAGCQKLSYLFMKEFAPEQVDDCSSMFTDVTSELWVHISYYLPCEIQQQIPSMDSYMTYTTSPVDVRDYVTVYNHPAQVLYVKNPSGEYELRFIKSSTQYKKNDKYIAKTKVTHGGTTVVRTQTMTVEDAWGYDNFKDTRVVVTQHGERSWNPNKHEFVGNYFTLFQVSNTKNSIPWENMKSTIKRVVFEESFSSESTYCQLDRYKSTRQWFSGCTILESITGMEHLTTKYVEDMKEMFKNCGNLRDFTLFGFTDVVTDMKGMFQGCKNLKNLDLSSWLTWKVSDMSYMFYQCISLQNLNLEAWNTNSLNSCGSMFYQVPRTCRIKICNTISSKIYDVQLNKTKYPYLMVDNCKPRQVHRSNQLGQMQGNLHQSVAQVIWTKDDKTLTFVCSDEVKVGDDFNDHTVTAVWRGEAVTHTPENEAPGWAQAVIKGNTLEAVRGSVYGKVTKVVIDESFSSEMPLSTSHWFRLGPQMKTLVGLENLNTSQVVSMSRMFHTCGATTLNVMKFNTSQVKSMEGMFADCVVSKLDGIVSFNTANVTNMADMFRNCSNLQSLSLRSFDVSKVSDFSYMLNGCTKLKTIHIKDFNAATNALRLSMYVFDGITDSKVYVDNTEEEYPNLRYDFSRMGFSSTTGTILFLAPQVIWTEGNKTLTFIGSRSNAAYAPGDQFNGQTVTAVWSGSDVLNTPVNNSKVPWTNTVNGNLQKVVFDQSFRDVKPKSTAYWFAIPKTNGNSSGETDLNPFMAYEGPTIILGSANPISGLEYLNTSEVTDMSGMFYNWEGPLTIDMRDHNTEKVTSMKEMFAYCKKVTLIGLNTTNVTNMEGMFKNFTSKTLDISDFNTNMVTNADQMFYEASINNLIVGPDFQFKRLASKAQLAFKNVTNMTVTFDPKSTTDNDVAVAVENAMLNKLGFVNSTNGTLRIDLSYRPQVIWTADNKTLSFVYTSRVYVGDTFNGYTVTRMWSDEQVTNSSQTGLPAWISNKVTSVSGLVTKVVIDESFSVVKPKSTLSWFNLNKQLTTISGLEYLNTSEVVTMCDMFYAYGGTSLDVSNFNTSKVTSMKCMFSGCSSLTSLDLSNFDTGNVTDMRLMFYGCTALETLTFSDKFKTQKVTDMGQMFQNCSKLASLDITSFDMSKVTDLDGMFINCNSLKTMKITDFNVSSSVASNSQKVFYKVTGLTLKVNQLESSVPNLRSTLSKLGFTSTTGTIEFNKINFPKPAKF